MKSSSLSTRISLEVMFLIGSFEVYGMDHRPAYQLQIQGVSGQPQAQVIGQQVESSRGQNEEQSYNQVKSTIMQQAKEEDERLPPIMGDPNFMNGNSTSMTTLSPMEYIATRAQERVIRLGNYDTTSKSSLSGEKEKSKKPKPLSCTSQTRKIKGKLRSLRSLGVEYLDSFTIIEKSTSRTSEETAEKRSQKKNAKATS